MEDHTDNSSPAPNPQNPTAPPAALAPGSLKVDSGQRAWERLRKVFACNPFYLLSAALLLYSFYLVSADRNFLPTEVGQLSFNLSSLQVYQILLVITAVFLAGRAVWYDSTLLVGLENLLLLVPFILISQAALIDARLVWVLSLAAGLLAAGRVGLLRRFISRLNFPPRLGLIGLFVVGVNAALPVIYRALHESKFGTKPDWGAAYETNQYIWWVLVPLLCVLSSAVPWSRVGSGRLWPERRWLPLGLFSLWLIGTSVHLYCLGYVYDFALRPELLAPAIWTLVWMFAIRAGQVLPWLKQSWKPVLWVPALLATLLAFPQREKVVFLVLTGVNLGIFASIYMRARVPLVLHFALISMVALVAELPEDWGRALVTQFSREAFIASAAVVYALICIALRREPKLGILGSLVAAIAVSIGGPQPDAIHWGAQSGLVFLLLHSLRWKDSEHPGANVVRWLAALAWVAHSVAWTHSFGADWETCVVAIPVIGTWFLFRWVGGKWGPLTILVASLLVLLTTPGDMAAIQLQSAPAGLLAVIGSFVLFGLGTLGAITKHRWGLSG